MITDYFTKPIQGSLVRKRRDIIMGPTIFLEDDKIVKIRAKSYLDQIVSWRLNQSQRIIRVKYVHGT